MSFWGRRGRDEPTAEATADADLARRARTALVAADERIRATGDELAFATAELGESATEELKVGLAAVREHMTEAFQLHQLCHDHIPDTAEELRSRYARILQLCEWAESVLDERTSALQKRVELARRAPEVLQSVRDDVARLQARLPETRDTLARLTERYLPAALQRVRMSADDAEQLLDFALQSADMSERRRAMGRTEEANLALETATESVRRARSVFDSVDSFEFEALRTQATLTDVIADSRDDLIEVRALRRTPKVDAAITALEEALSQTATGPKRDPFADLARLSAANAALDTAREAASRPIPSIEHVRNNIATADRSLAVASSLINGHRGWIGADARTRFAEAQRIRSEIDTIPEAEETRDRRLELARRVHSLAEDSVKLAQRDIDSSKPDNDDWGSWGNQRDRGGDRRNQGSNILGPVIGGVILGSILDGIFD